MTDAQAGIVEDHDTCAPTLVGRLAATLDRDPDAFAEGELLPRGWHGCLFAGAVPTGRLPADGYPGPGIALPDLGLPRVMAAGRRVTFHADIRLGDRLVRRTRIANVVPKSGRSGRFALVTTESTIHPAAGGPPLLTESQDYVLREAAPAGGEQARPAETASEPMPQPAAERRLVPDAALLFRFSAVTFNTHRIHYDLAWATGREGYPALVVHGPLSALLTLDFATAATGRTPASFAYRNRAPLYCDRPLRIAVSSLSGEAVRAWVEDDAGRVALDGSITFTNPAR